MDATPPIPRANLQGNDHHVSGAKTLIQTTGGSAITPQLIAKIPSTRKCPLNFVNTCKHAQAITIITHRERSKNGDIKLVSSAIIIIKSNPTVKIISLHSLSSRGNRQERRIIKYKPISTAKYHSEARPSGGVTELKKHAGTMHAWA